jgi:uracil-DNA glycosylase
MAVIIDFKEVLKDWESPLSNSVLKSQYMQKLLTVTHKDYKRTAVRPDKSDIFRAFRLTKFKDVRVVIIGQEPYPNRRATGLAFGNEFATAGTTLSPALDKIEGCIERTCYEDLNLNFDPTLVSWGQQGVLLLNSALTVENGKPGSHLARWRKFIRKVVEAVSEEKAGVCFLLLGAQAKMFRSYINNRKHYVFDYAHPGFAAINGQEWNCPHFKSINEVIELQNGKEYCIKW